MPLTAKAWELLLHQMLLRIKSFDVDASAGMKWISPSTVLKHPSKSGPA